MAQRLYKVTRDFTASVPGGVQEVIKSGRELWAELNQEGEVTRFQIDNLDFEVSTATFSSSTKLKGS